MGMESSTINVAEKPLPSR